MWYVQAVSTSRGLVNVRDEVDPSEGEVLAGMTDLERQVASSGHQHAIALVLLSHFGGAALLFTMHRIQPTVYLRGFSCEEGLERCHMHAWAQVYSDAGQCLRSVTGC